MSDEELFRQFLTDDAAAAFQQIHARHADMIERLCFARLHNAEDARDAAQETFMVLLRRRNKLQPVNLLHYLRRIARYTAAEIQRKRAAAERIADKVAADTDQVQRPDEIHREEIDLTECTQTMLKALETMKPGDQYLLRQHFLLGAGVKEIAKALEISEHATRARQSRALKRLRRRINLDAHNNPK